VKCNSCGGPGEKFIRFVSDGMVKEINYCTDCLRRSLREAPVFSKEGIKYIAAHIEIVQDTDLREISPDGSGTSDVIFSIAPVAVLRILFDKDNVSQTDLNEAAKRRIYVLQHRLEEALKQEDYKTANKIKKQINDIRERILEK
jgi:hypothetical protein